MKALLLAAGYGTRLSKYTKHSPKCLLKISGQTMLDHWIYKLNALGVEEFIVNTHYLADQVNDFISKHKMKDKIIISHEKELLGTAKTLIKHSNILNKCSSFIVHVDNYCEDNLFDFVEAHKNRPRDTLLSMLTFFTKSPSSCGVVELDESGRLISFYEKQETPPSSIANGAVYIAEPDFFKDLAKVLNSGVDISNDLIPKLLGKIYCYQTKKYYQDIGTEQTYHETVQFSSN